MLCCGRPRAVTGGQRRTSEGHGQECSASRLRVLESLALCSVCPCLVGVSEMLIASGMSSSSCRRSVPCCCCLTAVAESSTIYSVIYSACRSLWGTFRVFLLFRPPPSTLSHSCSAALTSRLFPSLGYLSVVLPSCDCFLGFLLRHAAAPQSLPCAAGLGACPRSLFGCRGCAPRWHPPAGPGAEGHRPPPCLVAPCLSERDPPPLWGVWMTVLKSAFNGWWSLLSFLSLKIGESCPEL